MTTPHDHAPPSPHFIGDDLALDFINSAYGVGDARRDHFTDAQGLRHWLTAAGLDATSMNGEADETLLATARSLRHSARELIERRKRDEHGDVALLNRILALSSTCHQLVWPEKAGPSLIERQRADNPQAALLPVAEAIAALLATADFQLVRQCESDDCTLWFHDRTRSHHRRWCSQAMCGNRMKVAAFRARKRG